MTLEDLMRKYGTDKAQLGYAPHYERILEPFRALPVTLLEIGVYQGASLATWRDYMPAAKIVGFDYQYLKRLATGRVHIFQGDQGNPIDLERCAAEHGPFDIIIDDGSHFAEHHVLGLMVLPKHLKPGGVFVIEDLCVSPLTIDHIRQHYPQAEVIPVPTPTWPTNALAVLCTQQ